MINFLYLLSFEVLAGSADADAAYAVAGCAGSADAGPVFLDDAFAAESEFTLAPEASILSSLELL